MTENDNLFNQVAYHDAALETLRIQLNKVNDSIASYQKRLYDLTGCSEFGRRDRMDYDTCNKCFHNRPELFGKCQEYNYRGGRFEITEIKE